MQQEKKKQFLKLTLVNSSVTLFFQGKHLRANNGFEFTLKTVLGIEIKFATA